MRFLMFAPTLLGMAILFGIAALILLGLLGVTAWTRAARWNRIALRRLAAGSRIARTPRADIEYVRIGEGPAVLILHGINGGYDQGVAAAELLGIAGYEYLPISRPGYLRTPLEAGKTPEQQADAFADLLDALRIETAAVIGISAGGLPALQFALRHPERCRAVILISGVTQRLSLPREAMLVPRFRAIVRSDVASWFMAYLFGAHPGLILRHALSRDERRALKNSHAADGVSKLIATSVPMRARWDGMINDGAAFPTIETYPLEKIRVPTLILHGTSDDVVPFAHAEFAARRIPSARLVSLPGGSHFAAFLDHDRISRMIGEFLEAHHADSRAAKFSPESYPRYSDQEGLASE
ncbi:MAG: alpha/beta hydrolase [Candidatus Acidiferrales bacterium]